MLDPETQAQTLYESLSEHNRGHSEGKPLVFARAISFNTREKTNWMGALPEEDYKMRAIVDEFLQAPLGNQNCKIGLISCPTESYVANQAWDSNPWHISVIAIYPKSGGRRQGKIVVIYDPDQNTDALENEPVRQCRVARGIQRRILQRLRHHGGLAVIILCTYKCNAPCQLCPRIPFKPLNFIPVRCL